MHRSDGAVLSTVDVNHKGVRPPADEGSFLAVFLFAPLRPRFKSEGMKSMIKSIDDYDKEHKELSLHQDTPGTLCTHCVHRCTWYAVVSPSMDLGARLVTLEAFEVLCLGVPSQRKFVIR